MPQHQLEQSNPGSFDYNLRLFRSGDHKKVQNLYLSVMLWQSHSFLILYLKTVATSASAMTLYLVSILGIAIWTQNPALGRAISLAASGTVSLLLGLTYWNGLALMDRNVKEDLANLAEHYMLVPVKRPSFDNNEENEDLELEVSGPRGFWVVEATHRINGKTELAGCGGLDFIQKEDKAEAEIRRMVVSSRHTRRGIAAMVLKAMVVHARAHRLPSIYVSTSSMQVPAIKMYKKHGWVEEGQEDIPIPFVTKAYIVCMRLNLKYGQAI